MKYTVIEAFSDLQDYDYVYLPGEEFPREGYTPSKKRIEGLESDGNAIGKPVIQRVDKVDEEYDPEPQVIKKHAGIKRPVSTKRSEEEKLRDG